MEIQPEVFRKGVHQPVNLFDLLFEQVLDDRTLAEIYTAVPEALTKMKAEFQFCLGVRREFRIPVYHAKNLPHALLVIVEVCIDDRGERVFDILPRAVHIPLLIFFLKQQVGEQFFILDFMFGKSQGDFNEARLPCLD